MNVSPLGSGNPITRLQGSKAVVSSGGSQDVSRSGEDTVQISDGARYLSEIKRLPDIRPDKVNAARRAIADGTYETKDKLDVTVDRLLNDLR